MAQPLHMLIARMANRISAERGGLCGVNLARRHSAKNGGRKRWLQAGLWVLDGQPWPPGGARVPENGVPIFLG